MEYCQNGLVAVVSRLHIGPTRLLLILPGIRTRNLLIYYFLVLLEKCMDNYIHMIFCNIMYCLQPFLQTNPLLLLCHTCNFITKQPSKFHTLLHLPQRNMKIQIPIFAFNLAYLVLVNWRVRVYAELLFYSQVVDLSTIHELC